MGLYPLARKLSAQQDNVNNFTDVGMLQGTEECFNNFIHIKFITQTTTPVSCLLAYDVTVLLFQTSKFVDLKKSGMCFCSVLNSSKCSSSSTSGKELTQTKL